MEIREAAIRAIESEIVAKEGAFHVNGHYYASGYDADLQRRREAERRVRQLENNAQNLKADSVFKKACDMSDHAAERAKRAELFVLDPTCWHCGFQIQRLDFAAALHFNANGEWRLFHNMPCSMNAVMEGNARLEEVCAWCEKPFKQGERKVRAAFRDIHESPCAAEFDAFTNPDSRPDTQVPQNQEAA